MPTSTKARPQMSLDESSLDDPSGELERLLDDRESANEMRKPYMRTFKAQDALAKERVKVLIKERELGHGTYRCGEHVVNITNNEPREIQFERASSTVIRFKPAKT